MTVGFIVLSPSSQRICGLSLSLLLDAAPASSCQPPNSHPGELLRANAGKLVKTPRQFMADG
jgi:hypothetical protein